MATKYIPDPSGSSRAVLAIVRSKENFCWPTTMKDLKRIFGVAHLGSDIMGQILEALHGVGVRCFSGNGEPTQEKMPIILYIENCEHARCFARN